jgi:Rieske Fe-S protein
MNAISRRILGFGFISSLVSMAFPALAASVPTVKCRFLGQTVTFKGKLYTCIKGKSKGKSILMWDSGKLIPTASPSASQVPSTTPTPSPSSSPTISREPVIAKKVDIPVAMSSEVPINSTKSFTVKNSNGIEATYILARNSEGVIAMSATCPHNGCTVAIATEGLLCPCHSALFDPKNGALLRGPASYALDRFVAREVDGVIFITD